MFPNSAPGKHKPTRRKILRAAALVLALVSTSTRGLLARMQADDSAATQDRTQRTLAQLAHHLFPHHALPVGPYEEIAAALIGRASTDDRLARNVQAGIAELNTESSTPWLERDAAQQIAAIRKLVGGEFFYLVRTATIEHLYRNSTVWQLLGYQGSSVEFGGYVDRGFDDIDWLPRKSNAQ